MKIIGVQLSDKEMLGISGGIRCYYCSCNDGYTPNWYALGNPIQEMMDNCGDSHAVCTEGEYAECEVLLQ